MLLTIHNNNLQKVAYIDNEKQTTLNFFNDKWTRSLESGTSVFEFSVFKKKIKSDTVVEKAYKHLNERSFVSFRYKKKSYLFNVMKIEEDEHIIRCYCENLSLELLLEYQGAYKATKPMTFKEYLDEWGTLGLSKVRLGINQIKDAKKTLEWEGQETALARLISLARNFDAEIEFETKLQADSQLDEFVLNVYKAHDDKNQGVGRKRSDIVIKYGKNIKSIKRSIDKTKIYNAVKPVGRKEETKEKTSKVSNPATSQAATGGKKYTGGNLSYAGHPLSAELVQTILNLCVQRNLLPSGVLAQLYLESWWGASNVAKRDNNWGGITGGAQTRPSGVVVTTGSARPANEGGTYMHYASVDDYMKDYTYLLAEQTSGGRKMYGVKGKQNIEEYTKGLFRIGGALYDYAAAGYAHYIALMRDIRNGINRTNGNILDKLDDLWRQPNNQVTQPNQPVTRTVKADKVIAVINEMHGLKGRRVGSGQCYALAAWYSMKLGGPGLGGGVTGLSGLIGAGMAAGKIGTDYAWDRFGWSVVRPSNPNQLKAGAIANIKPYNAYQGTSVWGHVSIIVANNGSTVTVLEQNYAGRQYVVQNSYPASAYLGAIETLCYPPELKEGKTVEGRTETGSTPNVTAPEAETKEVSVSTVEVVIDPKKKQEWKNEKGEVEFYLEGSLLFAPISKRLYPSVLTGKETNDNWIRKDMEVETDSEDVLISTALRNLRKFCYPAITYEVDGFLDLDIGDTVKIQDTGFSPMLMLEARVSEQQISFSNPVENKTVFANFQALQNKVSDNLLTRMAKLAEKAVPYELKLSTDNGTTFKNNVGQSVLKASLERNGKVYQPLLFYKNGDAIIGTGNQLVVRPTDFENTLQVTVEAYLDDELAASAEVTFTEVVDGGRGPKGDKGDRGNDGLPGKAGADGRTPYVHFAYADSADGRDGFSLTQNGSKRYLGVCTNFNQADSTNPADYVWNDMVGSVSVGGENLIVNSAFPDNLDNWGYWEVPQKNANLSISSHDFYYNGARPLFLLSSKEMVPASTLRFPVKRNTDYSFNIQTFATGNLKGVDIYFLGRKSDETNKTFSKVVNFKSHTGSPSTTGVAKWHLTFNSGECDEGFIRIDNKGATNNSNSLLFFTELDCYEGTTDRAWQASPRDLEKQLNSKADSALTLEQINALNERAGIIQAEMEAKASAEILNNWIKTYQDFVKSNEAERAAAEKALVSSSQRVSTIAKNLGELSDRWNFIDTYMSSSNDGLVIGKNDGSSSMMFNPNGRISMFSSGVEVMYISQGVIHIENGIFSKTIQVGRYREEQYHINPDMNVIRYVGGF